MSPSALSSWVRHSGARGFTLLEVLVAFVVLILSLGAVFRTLSLETDSSDMVEHYAEALSIATSRLAEAGISIPLGPEGARGMVAQKYAWDVSIMPAVEPTASFASRAGAWRAYRLAVVVSWSEGGRTRLVALSTLRAGKPE